MICFSGSAGKGFVKRIIPCGAPDPLMPNGSSHFPWSSYFEIGDAMKFCSSLRTLRYVVSLYSPVWPFLFEIISVEYISRASFE